MLTGNDWRILLLFSRLLQYRICSPGISFDLLHIVALNSIVSGGWRELCMTRVRPAFAALYSDCVIAAGLVEVIIYSSPDDKKKNRGFCFLEYESHKAASLAKRRLGTGRIKVGMLPLVLPSLLILIPFTYRLA